jgi:hypothetical protein
MKDIYLFIYLLLCSPFINHVPEFIFFQGMVVEMVFNNEIQIYFFRSIYILKRKIYSCVYY